MPRKIGNVARYLVDRTRCGQMKTCPKCSLLSPDETVMCDCGYPFNRAAAARARLAGYEPLSERQRGRVVPWRVNWVGAFTGGLPFFAILVHRSLYALPAPEFVSLGFWGGVVGGVFIARWLYRRQFRARA